MNPNHFESTEIIVIEKFWKSTDKSAEEETVPPALVYADLVENWKYPKLGCSGENT
jgi:hypothetical protein